MAEAILDLNGFHTLYSVLVLFSLSYYKKIWVENQGKFKLVFIIVKSKMIIKIIHFID